MSQHCKDIPCHSLEAGQRVRQHLGRKGLQAGAAHELQRARGEPIGQRRLLRKGKPCFLYTGASLDSGTAAYELRVM